MRKEMTPLCNVVTMCKSTLHSTSLLMSGIAFSQIVLIYGSHSVHSNK